MQIPHFLEKNTEIGHYSGYRTTVHAEYFYELTSEDDLPHLAEAYQFSKKENIPFLIVSGGTNMLFAKDFFSGVVIKNSLLEWSYNQDSKMLHAFSDANIWNIALELEKTYGNSLWHRFIGLPGSIG
jgi:UDP-N-acetylenolpyruvoylglucosamine reductase